MIWFQLQSLMGSYPLALRGLGMTIALSGISLVLGTSLALLSVSCERAAAACWILQSDCGSI